MELIESRRARRVHSKALVPDKNLLRWNRFDHCFARPTGQFVALCAAVCFGLTLGCDTVKPTTQCVNTSDCFGNQECRLGVCRNPGETADSGIADAGQACAKNGTCGNGSACKLGTDCGSGFCVEGVCCNGACDKGCGTCLATGSVGLCRPKPKGQACGAFLCNGVTPACPETCASSLDCGEAFGCCKPGDRAYDECNVLGQAGRCTKLKPCSTFSDPFKGSSLNMTLWSTYFSGSGKATVADDTLALFPGDEVTGDFAVRQASVSATQRCSLASDTVTIEFGDLSALKGASKTGSAFASLNMDSPESMAGYEVAVVAGTSVTAFSTLTDGGFGSTTLPQPYDAQAMRFLQVAESGGFVTYSVSSNGKNGIAFDRKPALAHAGDVTFQMRLYTDNAARDAGPTVYFQSVNVLP